MPSPFPCSPVIRECLWKKTQIEKKKKKKEISPWLEHATTYKGFFIDKVVFHPRVISGTWKKTDKSILEGKWSKLQSLMFAWCTSTSFEYFGLRLNN